MWFGVGGSDAQVLSAVLVTLGMYGLNVATVDPSQTPARFSASLLCEAAAVIRFVFHIFAVVALLSKTATRRAVWVVAVCACVDAAAMGVLLCATLPSGMHEAYATQRLSASAKSFVESSACPRAG